MHMELKYNLCFDFLSGLHRFSCRREFRERQEEQRLNGLPGVARWIEEVEKSLPLPVQNDLDFLITRNPLIYWTVLATAQTPGLCETPEELFLRLEALTPSLFLERVRKALDLNPGETPDPEQVEKQLLEGNTGLTLSPGETGRLILSLFKSPHDYLPRIIQFYRDFHSAAWLPWQEQFVREAMPLLEQHRRLLEEDPRGYLDAVTGGNFSHLFPDIGAVPLLFAYTGDTDVYITTNREHSLAVIGAGVAEKIRQRSDGEKTDLLFSMLGDKKRLEIIRLLCCRSWYSNQLAEHFDLTPATMSYHLNKLFSAGIITVQPGEQNRFYYQLNRPALEELIQAFRRDLNLDRDPPQPCSV